jgi:hypothetical protein
MKNYGLFFILIILLSLNSFCQFRAKMLNVVNGEESNYDVYSELKQYRYEFEENNMKGIVIVNPDANQTFILFPENKLVHETTCDGIMSRMNDPVQSYMWYKKYGEEKSAGDEEISGYKSKIKELYQGDSKVFTVWYSEELNFPLKILSHFAENTYMELIDIEPWKPEASYFIVPEDYTEVDERMRPVIPELPAPESWDIKEASVPFEGTISRGTKLKIKVGNTVYHKLLISNDSENPAKVVRHLIRNRQELPDNEQGPLKYRSVRLYSGEKKTYTFDWKAGDVVILEVHEGNMNIEIFPE